MTKKISFMIALMGLIFSLSSFTTNNTSINAKVFHSEITMTTYYGGSASARVKDSDGHYRKVYSSTGCFHDSQSAAKGNLTSGIYGRMHSDETLATSISFSIKTCD